MELGSKSFSLSSVAVLKYFSFERSIYKKSDFIEVQENWEVDITSQNGRYLFLQPIVEGVSQFTSIQVNQIGLRGVIKNFAIQYKEEKLIDDDGMKMKIRIPFVKFPYGNKKMRIKVSFFIKSREHFNVEQSFYELKLVDTIPVDKVELNYRNTLAIDQLSGSDYLGFIDVKKIGPSGDVSHHFKLERPWLKDGQSKTAEKMPYLEIANTTWERIAESNGELYRMELQKKSPALEAYFSEFAENIGGDNKINLIHQLYKRLGKDFIYKQGGITFNFDKKIQNKKLADIWTSKAGNCTDFVLLFLKLLSYAGIDGEPVFVNSLPREMPFRMETLLPRTLGFNHVIVYVPELDLYIDPSSASLMQGDHTFFAVQSNSYANTYKLHLFSKKLHPPALKKFNRSIDIETQIEKIEGDWIASTKWRGQGEAYSDLLSMNKLHEKRVKNAQPDRKFVDHGYEFVKNTWVMHGNDVMAEAEISFSYRLSEKIINKNDELLVLPSTVAEKVWFQLLRDELTSMAYCFNSDQITEKISISGIKNLVLKNAHVDLRENDSRYTQQADYIDGNLNLTRSYTSNDSNNYCDDLYVSKKKSFWDGVISKKVLVVH
jgi:hypothetical protein